MVLYHIITYNWWDKTIVLPYSCLFQKCALLPTFSFPPFLHLANWARDLTTLRTKLLPLLGFTGVQPPIQNSGGLRPPQPPLFGAPGIVHGKYLNLTKKVRDNSRNL